MNRGGRLHSGRGAAIPVALLFLLATWWLLSLRDGEVVRSADSSFHQAPENVRQNAVSNRASTVVETAPATSPTASSTEQPETHSVVPSSNPPILEAGRDAPKCAMDRFARQLQLDIAVDSFKSLNLTDPSTWKSSPGGSTAFQDLKRRYLSGGVYMIHYKPLQKRRNLVYQYLHRRGVDVDHWVTSFDREDIDASDKKCLHSDWNPSVFSNKAKRTRHLTKGIEPLRSAQLSVVTKHHYAMYRVWQKGVGLPAGTGAALILEDDAVLRSGFVEKLQSVLASLEKLKEADGSYPYDLVMVGGCIRMHAYKKKFARKVTRKVGKHAYFVPEARCAHAYIVTPVGAQRMMEAMPLTNAIDFQMNRAIFEQRLRVVWVEPFLSIQAKLDEECVSLICRVSTQKLESIFDPLKPEQKDVEWDTVPEAAS